MPPVLLRFAIVLTSACTSVLAASDLVSFDLVKNRPVVRDVYVNGSGPYRFLIDTGAETNQLSNSVAREIGILPAFRVLLTTSAGVRPVPGSSGVSIRLGAMVADSREFLLTDLAAVNLLDCKIDGVLGQNFLKNFDYGIDFKKRSITTDAGPGEHITFRLHNGVMTIATSQGPMILDSGTESTVLFRSLESGAARLMLTAGGSAQAQTSNVPAIRVGDLSFVPRDPVSARAYDPKVAGLLPLSTFRSVYISNSGGYVTLH